MYVYLLRYLVYEGLEYLVWSLGGGGLILLLHHDSSSSIVNGCHLMSILLYSSIVSKYLSGRDWGFLYHYEMNMVRG